MDYYLFVYFVRCIVCFWTKFDDNDDDVYTTEEKLLPKLSIGYLGMLSIVANTGPLLLDAAVPCFVCPIRNLV